LPAKASRQFRETKGFAVLDHAFLPFWLFSTRLFAPRHNARIQFLIAQTRILRSRIAEAIRKLVRGMAAENVLWGCARIVGELKKIGCRVGKPASSKETNLQPVREIR
jgi:hypothetical protein